jgi:hypothetical protein
VAEYFNGIQWLFINDFTCSISTSDGEWKLLVDGILLLFLQVKPDGRISMQTPKVADTLSTMACELQILAALKSYVINRVSGEVDKMFSAVIHTGDSKCKTWQLQDGMRFIFI